MNNTTDNIPELKSPFEQLREVDAEGLVDFIQKVMVWQKQEENA